MTMFSSYYRAIGNTIQNINDIRPYAVIVSLFLSIVMNYHFVSNPDGLVYLTSAEAFIEQGLSQAYADYRWPLYAVLIGSTAFITGFSYIISALIVNMLLVALGVWMFISITQTLGANHRVQCLAAITILCLPGFNQVRDTIIRDFGYWAFMLMGLYWLIQFARKPTWLMAIAWWSSILLSLLFRIEGILFYLVPLVLLCHPNWSIKQRLSNTFKCLSLLLFLCLMVFLVNLLFPHFPIGRTEELVGMMERFFSMSIIESLRDTAQAATAYIDANNTHWAVFIVGLATFVFLKFVGAFSWFYLLLCGYGMRFGLMKVSKLEYQILMGFIFITSVVPLVLVITDRFVLSTRYVTPLAIFLALWVPYTLDAIITAYQRRQRQGVIAKVWLLPLVVVVLIYMAFDSLIHVGPSKYYLRQAGEWIDQHVAEDNLVYSNDATVQFYANRWSDRYTFVRMQRPLSSSVTEDFQYAAFRVDRNNEALRQELFDTFPSALLETFVNNKGDSVYIFNIEKKG